jgi:hypothetical protein
VSVVEEGEESTRAKTWEGSSEKKAQFRVEPRLPKRLPLVAKKETSP